MYDNKKIDNLTFLDYMLNVLKLIYGKKFKIIKQSKKRH